MSWKHSWKQRLIDSVWVVIVWLMLIGCFTSSSTCAYGENKRFLEQHEMTKCGRSKQVGTIICFPESSRVFKSQQEGHRRDWPYGWHLFQSSTSRIPMPLLTSR